MYPLHDGRTSLCGGDDDFAELHGTVITLQVNGPGKPFVTVHRAPGRAGDELVCNDCPAVEHDRYAPPDQSDVE